MWIRFLAIEFRDSGRFALFPREALPLRFAVSCAFAHTLIFAPHHVYAQESTPADVRNRIRTRQQELRQREEEAHRQAQMNDYYKVL